MYDDIILNQQTPHTRHAHTLILTTQPSMIQYRRHGSSPAQAKNTHISILYIHIPHIGLVVPLSPESAKFAFNLNFILHYDHFYIEPWRRRLLVRGIFVSEPNQRSRTLAPRDHHALRWDKSWQVKIVPRLSHCDPSHEESLVARTWMTKLESREHICVCMSNSILIAQNAKMELHLTAKTKCFVENILYKIYFNIAKWEAQKYKIALHDRYFDDWYLLFIIFLYIEQLAFAIQ